MKSKDTQLLEEAYNNIAANTALRQMWQNDTKNVFVNEGFGDTVKTKLVKPLVDFFLKKIKETAPDTFEALSKAIQSKNESSVTAIFNDPAVKQEQNKISQQVTTESLTYISEEDKSPSLIKSVWAWAKNNPKLSAVAALAGLAVIGLAVYGSGGVVPLLMAVGTKSLAGATSGSIGGAVLAGAKSAIQQGKEGSVNLKQTAKDALKGGAIGGAAGAVGGALGAVGHAAAAGAGSLADEAGQWIKKMMAGESGSKALAYALQNPNLDPTQKRYMEMFLDFYKEGSLREDELSAVKNEFIKLGKGEPLSSAEFNNLKSTLLDLAGANKAIASGQAITNAIDNLSKKTAQTMQDTSTALFKK